MTGLNEYDLEKILPRRDKWNNSLYFIIIEDLPDMQREPFQEWISELDQPVIDYLPEGSSTAYYWDYELWYDYWIRGEVAPQDRGELDEIKELV